MRFLLDERPMLRAAPALALLVLLPRLSFAEPGAEPAAEPADEPRPSRVRGLLELDLRGEGQVSPGDAQARSELGVRAEFGVRGSRCEIFTVGAAGRGFAAAAPSVSQLGLQGEQWLSLCLRSANRPTWAAIHHHLDFAVRPSFAAPPIYWTRPVTLEKLDFELHPLSWDLGSGRHFDIFTIQPRYIFVRQSDGERAAWLSQMGATVAPIGFGGARAGDVEGWGVELLAVDILTAWFAGDGVESWGQSLVPARLRGIRLGSPRLLLDIEAGYGHGHLARAATGEAPEMVVHLVDIDTIVGSAVVRGALPGVDGSLGYTRRILPGIDGTLTLEDRVAGAARIERGRAVVSLSSFFANSVLYTRRGGRESARTGGGEVRVDVGLRRHLRLGLSVEAARSFYARLTSGDPHPRPGFGVRVFGVLSASLGSRI